MAPTDYRAEDFCIFSAYGAVLSASENDKQEVDLTKQDTALFNRNGRYSVIHEIAPHLTMEMRLRLFVAFREKVSEALKAKLEDGGGATDYDEKSFDPLLIRKWFSTAPLESNKGLCGVGAEFAWTEEQKDFLGEFWESFNNLISMEAGTNAQRMVASKNKASGAYQNLIADISCMPCDEEAIQISSRFDERVDAVEKSLRKEHAVSEDDASKIEEFLKQKHDFLQGGALDRFRTNFFDSATEQGVTNRDYLARSFFNAKKGGQKGQVDLRSMQERIFKDLVRLNDHFYIILPDLCRRLCDASEGGLFAGKVKIMDGVAAHVSRQYRAEQTDLSLLENMRRVRFEREQLAMQLVDELLNGEDDNGVGGLKLAKCPPGCVC